MNYCEKINTPIKGEYDVIVAGSGPAGIAAAISSARHGAKTLLVENSGCVGGMSTVGLMSHWTGSVNSRLYSEVLRRAADMNTYNKGNVQSAIDPELLKILYIEMLEEAGVELLLYTIVCGVMKSDNKVCGIISEGKGGRIAYSAKVVIDCSGDGDVAYFAGAEYFKGRENDGKMQPATLMFKVAGVDMDKAVFPGSFEELVETPKGELQSLARQKLPSDAGHVLLYKTTIPGVVTCNMTNTIDVDGTDVKDLTRAEISCRKQMLPIVNFLREFVPGYENCYIISGASLIGIRETRHFKGLYKITEEDILQAREFDDWVVRDARFNFDIHNMSGSGLDETGCQKHFKQSNGYTIPYRCLIPEKVDGLLLSGRNISGTHMAHSNFRAMPICFAIGEAGGIAAAIAVENNIELRNVSADTIQKSL